MQVRSGSASEFILNTLRQYADRELRSGELVDLAGGRYSKENIVKSLYYLLEHGAVVRVKDDGATAWWAVSAAGLADAREKV